MACLSVSQLNELARASLQAGFPSEIWVQGEIQGLKVHAKSGHLYFDLVEKGPTALEGYIAKISCAFFRGPYTRWRSLLASLGAARFDLSSGIEVRLKARADLFVKEGRYQLIVSEIDPAFTLGAIAKKREQTIQSLRALGLLDRNKGLPFPEIPLNIGLITSGGSAAMADFMRVLSDSPYCFSVSLFDAHMQGENTVPEVIRGIRTLERHPDVDSIVIIRGGGAKTDLFSVDDIALCRAVALCAKPVVTGIGHEIDVSVADLAAHTYRVTPTDVARHYVALADGVWAFLDGACRDLGHRCEELLRRDGQKLGLASAGLGHIANRWMASSLSLLQGTAFKLHTVVARTLAVREQALAQGLASLGALACGSITRQVQALDGMPSLMARDARRALLGLQAQVEQLGQDVRESAQAMMERQNDRLGHLHSLVSLLDPAETLKRGFSITLDCRGRVIRDAAGVAEGESIVTKLPKGKIRSVVTGKEPQ